ncbi:MAG: acyl-CoA dehydrogenase, partial [Xanthobacteraceae bacterium]|nr:acyl-CoA dehydrogenase [Xanthobacteraceae bacterium]
MPQAARRPPTDTNLLALGHGATAAVEALLSDAAVKVRERVVLEGQPAARLMDREQRATHGLAWL